MPSFETIITQLDYITIVFAFFAMIASGYNYIARKKEMNEIEIFISINHQKRQLPIKIIRKNVTRAEIKGIMSDFDKDHNFTISYLKSPEFMNDIFLIQRGKKDSLIIKINDSDKFNFDENEIFPKDFYEDDYYFRYDFCKQGRVFLQSRIS